MAETETQTTKKTLSQSIVEMARNPQITPAQIAVFIFVQILSTIQGILPGLISGEINLTWWLASYIIDNVAYLLILILRGVALDKDTEEKLTGFIGTLIDNIKDTLFSNDLDESGKIDNLERLTVWTVRELDALYQSQMRKFIEKTKKDLEEKIEAKRNSITE